MDYRPLTLFIDIDGTLVYHQPPHVTSRPDYRMVTIDGVIEKLIEWDKKGYKIILVTGRKESMRKETERQLSEIGVAYDQLIMGIGGGKRILINDTKPHMGVTCEAYCIERDKGIKDLNI